MNPNIVRQMNDLNIIGRDLVTDPMSVSSVSSASSTDDSVNHHRLLQPITIEDDLHVDDEELASIEFDFETFEKQRRLHEEMLKQSSKKTILPPPPQIAIRYASLEKEIRKHREVTKQLKTEQRELEDQFVSELESLPNGAVETNDLHFSIRTRKKRSRMDTNHIVTCIASYAAHYGMVPSDEPRRSEFVQLHQDLKWIADERSTKPNDATLRQHHLDLNMKKKEMYMFMAMDIHRYIERSRSEMTVPFLSRRSKKRRMDQSSTRGAYLS